MPQSIATARLVRDSEPAPTRLQALRSEIDRIDDAMLDLIEQRLCASLSIAELKQETKNPSLLLRPRRQAEIVERLASRCRRVPSALVAHIWRELMAYSLQAQIRTELFLCASNGREALSASVRSHFGSAAPMTIVGQPGRALQAALHSEAVAIIAVQHAEGLAEILDPALSIFDEIRGDNGALLALAVGRIPVEETAGIGDGR